MFIRQVTYSKNDPARPAYAAGQGIAVAAGGIKGKLFFSHKRHFLFTHVFAPPLSQSQFSTARFFAAEPAQVRQHADKPDPPMP